MENSEAGGIQLDRFWVPLVGTPTSAIRQPRVKFQSELSPALEAIDPRLLEASAVLGAGRLRTFAKVILPLSLPGIVTAVVLSFAHTLGEFGVVLMVGGNLAGVTRTVSIDIYDHVQSLEYAEANRMALVLLIISFAVLSVVYGVNRKIGRRVWALWAAR